MERIYCCKIVACEDGVVLTKERVFDVEPHFIKDDPELHEEALAFDVDELAPGAEVFNTVKNIVYTSEGAYAMLYAEDVDGLTDE